MMAAACNQPIRAVSFFYLLTLAVYIPIILRAHNVIRYVNSSDEEQVKAQANTVDCLIVTINSSVDWTPYVTMLRPNGKLLFVGAITDAPISVPIFGS